MDSSASWIRSRHLPLPTAVSLWCLACQGQAHPPSPRGPTGLPGRLLSRSPVDVGGTSVSPLTEISSSSLQRPGRWGPRSSPSTAVLGEWGEGTCSPHRGRAQSPRPTLATRRQRLECRDAEQAATAEDSPESPPGQARVPRWPDQAGPPVCAVWPEPAASTSCGPLRGGAWPRGCPVIPHRTSLPLHGPHLENWGSGWAAGRELGPELMVRGSH